APSRSGAGTSTQGSRHPTSVRGAPAPTASAASSSTQSSPPAPRLAVTRVQPPCPVTRRGSISCTVSSMGWPRPSSTRMATRPAARRFGVAPVAAAPRRRQLLGLLEQRGLERLDVVVALERRRLEQGDPAVALGQRRLIRRIARATVDGPASTHDSVHHPALG